MENKEVTKPKLASVYQGKDEIIITITINRDGSNIERGKKYEAEIGNIYVSFGMDLKSH